VPPRTHTYALYPRTSIAGGAGNAKHATAANADTDWGRPTGTNGHANRQADRAEDIQFWRDIGYTHEDIATKLGIALESHYRWLDRHGHGIPNMLATQPSPNLAAIAALYTKPVIAPNHRCRTSTPSRPCTSNPCRPADGLPASANLQGGQIKGHLIVTIDPGATRATVHAAREELERRLGPGVTVTILSANGVSFIPFNEGDK
jgi:hypothetical protein